MFNGFRKTTDADGDLTLDLGVMYIAEVNDPRTYTLPKVTPDNRGRVICVQLTGVNTIGIATTGGDTLYPEALAGNQFSSGIALFLVSDGDSGWAQTMSLAGGPPRTNP